MGGPEAGANRGRGEPENGGAVHHEPPGERVQDRGHRELGAGSPNLLRPAFGRLSSSVDGRLGSRNPQQVRKKRVQAGKIDLAEGPDPFIEKPAVQMTDLKHQRDAALLQSVFL